MGRVACTTGARVITTSALIVARSYLGLEEIAGREHNPGIVQMLRAVAPWATSDEIPWCSAFVFEVALRLGLPRPQQNPARARSWLTVGKAVGLHDAKPEEDVVIFKRGGSHAGPEVLDAPGHVAFFMSLLPGQVEVLGGNQGDAVSVARFHQADVLGVRRLA